MSLSLYTSDRNGYDVIRPDHDQVSWARRALIAQQRVVHAEKHPNDTSAVRLSVLV